MKLNNCVKIAFFLTCAISNSHALRVENVAHSYKNRQTVVIESPELSRFSADDFAAMNLEDPRLQSAYIHVFEHGNILFSMSGMSEDNAFALAALFDLKRRSNEVSELLLRLCSENQDSILELSIIQFVRDIPGLDLSPFVNYARTAIENRWEALPYEACERFALLLAHSGSDKDYEILEKLKMRLPVLGVSLDKIMQESKLKKNPSLQKSFPTVENPAEDGVNAHLTTKLLPSETLIYWWAATALFALILLLFYARWKRNRGKR